MKWFERNFYFGQHVACFLGNDPQPILGQIYYVHPTTVEVICDEGEAGRRVRIIEKERVFALNPEEAAK